LHAEFDLLESCIRATTSELSGWDIEQETKNLPSNKFERMNGNLVPAEMFIASQSSPIAAVLAGKFGLGMLSLDAITTTSVNNLSYIWEIYQKNARENGHVCDRSRWSLALPMHLAKTNEDAQRDAKFGLNQWAKKLQKNTTFSIPEGRNPSKRIIETRLGIIGTHIEAIKKIKEVKRQSGGFGCLLLTNHNWANLEKTKQSLKIFRDHVIDAI